MSDNAQPSYTSSLKRWDGVWKYIAIAALGLCAGLIEGQLTPNRNIVTQDEFQKVSEKIDALTDKVSELNATVFEMRGEQQASRDRK